MRRPSPPHRRRLRGRRGRVVTAAVAGALGLAIAGYLAWKVVDIYNEDNDFFALATVTDPRTGAEGPGRVRVTVAGETITSGDDGFEAIDEPYRDGGFSLEVGRRIVIEVTADTQGHQAYCDIAKDSLIGGDSSVSVSEGFQRKGADTARATCSWTRGRYE